MFAIEKLSQVKIMLGKIVFQFQDQFDFTEVQIQVSIAVL